MTYQNTCTEKLVGDNADGVAAAAAGDVPCIGWAWAFDGLGEVAAAAAADMRGIDELVEWGLASSAAAAEKHMGRWHLDNFPKHTGHLEVWGKGKSIWIKEYEIGDPLNSHV